MHEDPRRLRRRSLRLRGYDYAQAGRYFFTICTQHRACLLGEVVDSSVRLNEAGEMVQSIWTELPVHYPGVDTDAFVVMPNHLHGIVLLTGERDGLDLPAVVHRLKTLTTKRYLEGVRDRGWPPFLGRLWQRNYYEHVVRDEASLGRIRQYIEANPARWAEDPDNPENLVEVASAKTV